MAGEVMQNEADFRVINNGGKVGAAAGWTVGDATNVGTMGLMAASQTAGTLVVRIDNLKVGDIIEGFCLIGQIESAGGTVTVDAALRSLTAAAADLVDASVASMTQLSITADTLMNSANTNKTGFFEKVVEGKSYYFLITATTAGSTDIALQAIVAKVRSIYHK